MAHFFPLIVAAIVIIARLIARAGNQTGGTPPTPHSPRPRAETEEDRMRRFMEAVGLPPGTPPPPLVRPRTPAEPPPLLPVNPPNRLYPDLAPGRLRRAAPASPPTARARTPISAQAPAAPVSQRAQMAPMEPFPGGIATAAPPASARALATAPAPSPSSAAKSLLLRLRDPASVREAIILREVLGPPRAFQPFEQQPSPLGRNASARGPSV